MSIPYLILFEHPKQTYLYSITTGILILNIAELNVHIVRLMCEIIDKKYIVVTLNRQNISENFNMFLRIISSICNVKNLLDEDLNIEIQKIKKLSYNNFMTNIKYNIRCVYIGDFLALSGASEIFYGIISTDTDDEIKQKIILNYQKISQFRESGPFTNTTITIQYNMAQNIDCIAQQALQKRPEKECFGARLEILKNYYIDIKKLSITREILNNNLRLQRRIIYKNFILPAFNITKATEEQFKELVENYLDEILINITHFRPKSQDIFLIETIQKSRDTTIIFNSSDEMLNMIYTIIVQ